MFIVEIRNYAVESYKICNSAVVITSAG